MNGMRLRLSVSGRLRDTLRRAVRNRDVSGGLWIFAGRAFFAASALLVNILLSRLLAPAGFGAYMMAFNIAFFGGVLGVLGLNQSIIRFVSESLRLNSRERAKRAVRLSLQLAVLGGLGAGTLYVLLQTFLLKSLLGPVFTDSAAIWTGLWILLNVLQGLLSECFRAFGFIKEATLFSGVLSNFLMLCAFGFMMGSGIAAGIEMVLAVITVGQLFSCLTAGICLLRRLQKWNQRLGLGNPAGELLRVRELLRVSFPIMASNAALFLLTSSDIWILGIFRGEEEAAVYGAAVRLMAVLNFFVVLMNTVMTTLLSRPANGEGHADLMKPGKAVVALVTVPAMLVAVCFVLFGKQIMEAAFGAHYGTGYSILAVLSLGQLVNLIAGPSGLLLTLTGHERIMLRITAVTSVFTAGGAVIAAYGAGPLALAWVMVAGLLLQNGWMWTEARKRVGISLHFSPVFILREIAALWPDRREKRVTH